VRLGRSFERALPRAIRLGRGLLAAATLTLVGAGMLFARAGTDFVLRIFEGDLLVTIMRDSASIGLDEARVSIVSRRSARSRSFPRCARRCE
jgi:Cu/Ag efflux pump CusA